MKKDKYFFSWLFAVIVLSLLLILSIYLGVSGWYFQTEHSKVTDFQLGNNIQINLKKNSANSVSLNFSGSFISGEKLPQVVTIKNEESDNEMFLRARAFVYSSANEKENVSLTITQNWVYNATDGYYYYTEGVPAQNKISLCSQIYLDETVTLTSKQTYIITFLVESVSYEGAIKDFWGFNMIPE